MISIIAAVARNGVIGGNNNLLWHISEDLKRFKALTSGHPVVMGRKTWESLGRPLPNRTNVVVTRNRHFASDGCTAVGSLAEAFGLFGPEEEIFVIGGGQIYAEAMALADRLYITWVEADYEGDTRFPEVEETEWMETGRERHEGAAGFEHPFIFVDYVRR